jgi:phage pi2 protein 07
VYKNAQGRAKQKAYRGQTKQNHILLKRVEYNAYPAKQWKSIMSMLMVMIALQQSRNEKQDNHAKNLATCARRKKALHVATGVASSSQGKAERESSAGPNKS